MSDATGADLIRIERERQINVEQWSTEHDDQHTAGELALAAAVYATTTQQTVVDKLQGNGWPWEMHWFKPFKENAGDHDYRHSFPEVDRVRCLVKAGALIAAEIDRLQREQSDEG